MAVLLLAPDQPRVGLGVEIAAAGVGTAMAVFGMRVLRGVERGPD